MKRFLWILSAALLFALPAGASAASCGESAGPARALDIIQKKTKMAFDARASGTLDLQGFAACRGPGDSCRSSMDCCGSNTCRDGACEGSGNSCRGPGATCRSSLDCCSSSFCTDGYCSDHGTQCSPRGERCDSSLDCCGSNFCKGGICG